MATYQRTETVDAREFTGGVDTGMSIVLWINSHNGIAMYDAERDIILLSLWGEIFNVHVTDMVVLRQDGQFENIRREDFKLLGYKQV
ncbi:hypothetical protein SEA_INKED_71 [Arthrobacter phage Inked]|nr:hypothetical protein SEA_INKED_71 [Arthrobacter phage Inked]